MSRRQEKPHRPRATRHRALQASRSPNNGPAWHPPRAPQKSGTSHRGHALGGALALIGLAALNPGCERASGRYDHADRPEQAPRVVGKVPAIAEEAKAGERSVTMDADAAAECGRGTGRNADGVCVGLGLLEVGDVQQVQIPGGTFVMGHIPRSYDLRLSRETPAVR
ncbi:MAG TPA: hypothetical protein ENK31_06270, partial [Nannocystis exedens]|nr:hypothetical protein [Nannocystis exedens]